MAEIKPLSEQTLMNNYVFSMVMRDPRRIKPLLQAILGLEIRSVRMVEPEKTLKERFEAKGIRLDLYVEDTDGVIYDVVVQTTDEKNLPRRMRYYQGMLDLSFFPAGAFYDSLRKSFVIFICSFDPFGRSQYLYTFQYRCDQDAGLLFGDDTVKVVVNTKGTQGMISPELKEAILYLDREAVTGPYSRELDEAVNELKSNEERGAEYMTLMTYGMEQQATGRKINQVENIRNWYKAGQDIPKPIAAKVMNLSLPVFDGVLDLIREHPDWDDETVAGRAVWRQ